MIIAFIIIIIVKCKVCVNISRWIYYHTDVEYFQCRAPAAHFRFLEATLFIRLNSSARIQTAKKQLCAFDRFISTFRHPQFGCFIPQSILIFIHLLLHSYIPSSIDNMNKSTDDIGTVFCADSILLFNVHEAEYTFLPQTIFNLQW